MEQHGEKIKHVKPIASDARNGETCTTPEIVWFELPVGREKMELVKRKLFDEEKVPFKEAWTWCKCGKHFTSERNLPGPQITQKLTLDTLEIQFLSYFFVIFRPF